ncbi:hypothetical protein LSH36_427g05023 [Paralvinella palmiformis]|uniref:Uncharacterized protein n=1 Tax=Paralvinella palmiformis TaxID=53620 RepID=A0AAD9MYD5_9ANNE|nr:hypothetical protein LSH36_427g05023 [Paralvinella palmiformis]
MDAPFTTCARHLQRSREMNIFLVKHLKKRDHLTPIIKINLFLLTVRESEEKQQIMNAVLVAWATLNPDLIGEKLLCLEYRDKESDPQVRKFTCVSSSEAYRKIYIEGNNKSDSPRAQHRTDQQRPSLGSYLDQVGRHTSSCNTSHTHDVEHSSANDHQQNTQSPYCRRKQWPRPTSTEPERVQFQAVDRKPVLGRYQTYPGPRTRSTRPPLLRQDAIDVDSNPESDGPHQTPSASSILRPKPHREREKDCGNINRQNRWSLASHGDRLPAKRLPVDENSTDAIREDGINRTVVFNSRCRSRSFAGDDRDLVGATLRKRSWSVSDSDGCQSSISGEGLENTLVSLVKNEWHSQANVNDSQRNGGSLKGILKHRSNSCHQVGRGEGDSEAERKPRTNSVSFVDTKFNESQLFSSSRYRKDDSAATNRGKIGSRAKLGASRSGKQNYGHASIPDGKPPIPRRHRSSSLSRALSKYQSLRTTHNKSPPLSVGATSETFTSRYLTDSGTYTSSLSSDDVPYERIDPPATTGPQRFDPSNFNSRR